MKTLLVLYAGDDFEKNVPFKINYKIEDSEGFYGYAEDKGVKVVRTCISSYVRDKGCFDRYWEFEKGVWNKVYKNIFPDVIWDKAWEKLGSGDDFGSFELHCEISKKYKFFNDPYFNLLFRNKLYQYYLLSDYMPESLFVTGEENVRKEIVKFGVDKVVVKPLFGSGGTGIYIGGNDFEGINLFYEGNLSNNFIIQRFIESKSYGGRIKDFRLVFVNNKLIYVTSRIAEEGSFFTNVAQGASQEHHDMQLIDKNVLDVAAEVNKKMSFWKNMIYSQDFIIDEKGKPWLMEVNTIPGFSYEEGEEAFYTKYYDAVLKFAF